MLHTAGAISKVRPHGTIHLNSRRVGVRPTLPQQQNCRWNCFAQHPIFDVVANQGTLLHVEDDEPMRRFVGLALAHAGYAVESVANGVDAIKTLHFAPRGFDLVVLDLVLPYVNGLDVLAAIRSVPATRPLPVLVTTGTFITTNQFAGDRLVSVLRKPFDDVQLVAAVGMTLHAARFGGAAMIPGRP